jgi:Zn-finger nucleic acid-binding protein
MRHFFSPKRRVEVDECPSCAGFWLDAGELALVREEHQAEIDRKRAVDKYLSDVMRGKLDEMRAGNTYVNVHTSDGVAPINTGPGDFPGGEIRGQIPG